jgi:cytochrome c peroxidase
MSKTEIRFRQVLPAFLVAATIAGGAAWAQSATPPPLAPLGDPPIPADNKQSAAKVELGKLLFFDPRLGGDASVACGTCHEPSQGWAFAEDISRGYPGTVHWRNSQTIINSAYYGKLFWAGSSRSLEGQARSAAKGGVAGNGEDDIMEARLALIPEYRKRFREVFGDEWPLIGNAWKAIAAFERAVLIQKDTPLDRYLKGDKSALTEQQVRGKEIFEGKANCIACHNGALASDEKFHNIGVPYALRWEEDGLAQITFRFEQFAKGVTEKMYREIKDDAGLYYRTKNAWDKGKFRTPSLRYTKYTAPYMHNGTFYKFRTPSLRYTKYTAPYMHNGTFYTMEEVVDFYDRGGVTEDGRTTDFPETKSALIKPLGLTDEEKEDLIAFLEAFSGEEILMDKPKLPEYAPLFSEAEVMVE